MASGFGASERWNVVPSFSSIQYFWKSTPYLPYTSRSFACASPTSLSLAPFMFLWMSMYRGMRTSPEYVRIQALDMPDAQAPFNPRPLTSGGIRAKCISNGRQFETRVTSAADV